MPHLSLIPEPPTPYDLTSLGWSPSLASALDALPAPAPLHPARVIRVDRGACDVLTAAGQQRAVLSAAVLSAGAADPAATPCVGDWVAVLDSADGRTSIEHVLPRATTFLRASVTPGTSRAQVLAANVDVVVIVEALLPEPDLGRLERFLALAWESGARPVVVLTKADLVSDAQDLVQDVRAAAPGVDVHAVSSVVGTGVELVRALLEPGTTIALLGASGAGKSTLTNALAEAEVMATRALRTDGKGRHTTVHRELVVMPGGGLVIDTPGLRSVGLTAADDGLSTVFSDIEELAERCRFTDCTHESEPGCAILAAVEDGQLPARRLASWRKLQREVRFMAMRHDARLRSEERSRWKRIHAEVRRSGRVRP